MRTICALVLLPIIIPIWTIGFVFGLLSQYLFGGFDRSQDFTDWIGSD